PAYKRMSIALQRQFKQTIHDVAFGGVSGYSNIMLARIVLVFCSIPPCSDAELINGGDDVAFLGEDASGKTLYWNFEGSDQSKLREKVFFSKATQVNLLQKLRLAQSRLVGAPASITTEYADNRVGDILTTVFQSTLNQGVRIDSLFQVEAGMVGQARD